MRTLTYIADEKLKKTVIPIGFVGENEHTRVIFICDKAFAEYPDAVPAISVRPPVGNEYPSIVVRNGNNVYWDVTDADLTHRGLGEVQLTFVQDNVVAKTYVAGTMIEKSIMGNGPAPEAIDDFIARASAAVAEIPQTINSALEEAKESGDFDGADGFSPTVEVTDIDGGHRITVVDIDGMHTADILDGEPGDDGYSPSVSVTSISGGHRVTITDKDGEHTFDVMDGYGSGTGGLPTGGNTGDLLIKSSGTDYAAEWVAPASAPEQDNTRPITAAAVYTEIGNINALLATI